MRARSLNTKSCCHGLKAILWCSTPSSKSSEGEKLGEGRFAIFGTIFTIQKLEKHPWRSVTFSKVADFYTSQK